MSDPLQRLHELFGQGRVDCIRCGFCLPVCPTYRLTGSEAESPRGRIALGDAYRKGDLPLREVRPHIALCLNCRACETACPAGVEFGRMVEQVKIAMGEDGGGQGSFSARDASYLRQLLRNPSRWRTLGRLLYLYQRTGVQGLARRTGWLGFLPRKWEAMEGYLPPIARPPGRLAAGRAGRNPKRRPSTALFTGCFMEMLFSATHEATVRLLERAGASVRVPSAQECCGALQYHVGWEGEARLLARRTIEAFEGPEQETIVVNSAGCGAHMKAYPHLFFDDPWWRRRAEAFAARVQDATEWLARSAVSEAFEPLPLRVVYDEPCHLLHAQGISEAPRSLLRSVPKLELLPLGEAEMCCGSAGLYSIVQPEMAEAVLRRKVAAVSAAAPDAVVTANPGCLLQIQRGLRQAGKKIPVIHIVDLLDRAANGSNPTLALWGL